MSISQETEKLDSRNKPANANGGPGSSCQQEDVSASNSRMAHNLGSLFVSNTMNPSSRRNTSMDLGDYFVGPRDVLKHSKWPLFMQMHGSILPKMIIPLIWMALWSSAITAIHIHRANMSVAPVLLTVLGFVVGMSLSFRTATAYERYAEGRRYWAQLVHASQCLARVFWIHASDPEDLDVRQSLLRKVSCLNLILALAVSLKHKLRFEPYTNYEDLEHLVGHLDTFANKATALQPDAVISKKPNLFKSVGQYLGLSFATSNPCKVLKRAPHPVGNLPLEILSRISSIVDRMVNDGQLKIPMQQTMAYNSLTLISDILTGIDRVNTTPLPVAYSISISQITWVYVVLLPFQLVEQLQWVCIPASVAAAYIILGILFIGQQIENPFGQDVNDLPLESYCEQIARELDVIASFDNRDTYGFVKSKCNLPLYPASTAPYSSWILQSEEDIRQAIGIKLATVFQSNTPVNPPKRVSSMEGEQNDADLAV